MAVPATSGFLRTTLSNMLIGDYIVCNYLAATSGAVGTFSNFGGAAGTEIPVAGSATPNGTFYFVKVDKGLLIADRVIQISITWDTLNAGRVIQGNPQTFVSVAGILRSPTGGVSYADTNGNSVNIAPSPQLGGWPTNSEYDKYLIQSNLNGTITTNDINVWHHNAVQTWTQDTPALAITTSTNHVTRGGSAGVKNMQNSASSTANATVGFRPAFQYQE